MEGFGVREKVEKRGEKYSKIKKSKHYIKCVTGFVENAFSASSQLFVVTGDSKSWDLGADSRAGGEGSDDRGSHVCLCFFFLKFKEMKKD